MHVPLQEGPCPVAVLVSGSGPQNRDSEIFGHKLFLVIADYLARNGIAVLRFDDRGVAESGGDFRSATTEHFVSDAAGAVRYLLSRADVIKSKIGIIGHSEGGIIAPMVAVNSRQVHFIVLLAGSGMKGSDLMLLQKQRIEQKMGLPELEVKKSNEIFAGAYRLIETYSADSATLKINLLRYFQGRFGNSLSEDQVSALVRRLTSPWMIYFLNLDPAVALEKVQIPVLAVGGAKDLQVPSRENLQRIEESLLKGGNRMITVKELENLNHLFQECETGLISEYDEIEQTISPKVLALVTNWINELK